jgi:UDP-N-acetylglucosamine--N-acetylmuramyl-(pentapeptide) pyrophosphoryl-undecaprenol N-acetylglucosamine transferase
MITGGGTAGHTSPAVAVIEELLSRDSRLALQWVGRRGAVEERVAELHSIPFRALPVSGWPRRGIFRRLWVAIQLVIALMLAFIYLRRFRPQAILAVGGYVSVPLTLVAQRLGIPTILHEQNRSMGLANRLLAKKASRILLSFEDTTGAFPKEHAQVVGNPVRKDFHDPPSKKEARKRLDLDANIPVIVVTGGSQGARTINSAMEHVFETIAPDKAQFIWLAGRAGAEAARAIAEKSTASVRVHAFVDNMADVCAASDLLISRAGASSTAEIAVLGRPSILIPYPAATDNHQEHNARAMESAGAAVVLLDAECTGKKILEILEDLISDSVRLQDMADAAKTAAHPAAADMIAEAIILLHEVRGEA